MVNQAAAAAGSDQVWHAGVTVTVAPGPPAAARPTRLRRPGTLSRRPGPGRARWCRPGPGPPAGGPGQPRSESGCRPTVSGLPPPRIQSVRLPRGRGRRRPAHCRPGSRAAAAHLASSSDSVAVGPGLGVGLGHGHGTQFNAIARNFRRRTGNGRVTEELPEGGRGMTGNLI